MKKKTKKELREDFKINKKLIIFKHEDLDELDWFENKTPQEAEELMLKRFKKLEKVK